MPSNLFENLTIVSITGSEAYIEGSIHAIQRSCEELPGSKALLISPQSPKLQDLPPYIQHIAVSPFGYMEYNIFVLYQLENFIDTEYCLIVQSDGWVMSGKNWREEFWDYDYIGAPIPYYGVYYKNHYHQIYSEQPLNNCQPMQNGGFSLRSKKMLAMPRRLNLQYSVAIPNPPHADETPVKMSWHHHGHHEDNFITGMHRQLFEQNGIKIAPVEVARTFSIEHFRTHLATGQDFKEILGIHLNGTGRLVGKNTVEVKALVDNLNCFTDNQSLIDYMIAHRLDVKTLLLFDHHINITQ